ncbi:hypothetical protein TNCT_202101 [Trichonephila clavata]|uniref:C2H2-type domain-containing protein n=1 Tax=Trichonephila clavata TaxID=2740835 RepID=A0A8X6EYS2_TRICU|nr:hypothetical protein TNCT_202101 [Trichonephila clavata]
MDREVSASCNKCIRSFRSKNLMKIHYMKSHYSRVCPNCSKTFHHTKKYLKHLRSHLNHFPYQCKICLKSFKDKVHLHIHKIRHSNQEKKVCRVCAEKCDDHPSLLRHLETHGEPPYECPNCSSRFSNLVDRTVHLKNHVLRCQLCKIPMKDKKILLYHINEVHRINKEECAPVIGDPHLKYPDVVIRGECDPNDSMAESSSSECSLSDDESDSSSIGEPDTHVDSVYEAKHEDKFICFICLQLCPTSELLKHHMKAHNWCPCPHCHEFFTCYQDLEMHKRENHSQCFICEAVLERETDLNLDMARCRSCSIITSKLKEVVEAVLEKDKDEEADIEQELCRKLSNVKDDFGKIRFTIEKSSNCGENV